MIPQKYGLTDTNNDYNNWSIPTPIPPAENIYWNKEILRAVEHILYDKVPQKLHDGLSILIDGVP